ncbi:MAG: mercury(II) reductase [Anaerolineales bacterium]
MTERRKLELAVPGMSCATCPDHVERALRSVAGVEDVQIPGWKSKIAEVTVASQVNDEDLLTAVRDVGYPASVVTSQTIDPEVIKDDVTGSNADGRKDFDLIVIGGGSAGFAAAIKGIDLGARVAMVEANTIGGTCVNVGCVPSKTLIQVANAWHSAEHHPFKGANTKQSDLDWSTIRSEKDALVADMRQSKYIDVLDAYPEITFIEGYATFRADRSISVGKDVYQANRYVITAGAQPNMVAFSGVEEAQPLNSTTVMDLEQLPKSIIILGGRAIALELGQTLARLGVEVLILQRSTRLVPDHEPRIGREIKDIFEHEGIGVITGAQVERIERDGQTRIVHASVMGGTREFRADQVLMALGRKPNTAGMGLENMDVELDERGAIVVDEYLQSSNPKIFAAGDVTQHPEFVYVAAAGGSKATQNAISDTKVPMDLSLVPSVIFTEPQIATVGMTEAEAKRQGHEVRVTSLDLEHVARAKAERNTEGFIRLIADENTNRLLGAHILAPAAGEVIQTATLAIKFGLTIKDLADSLFPYLTQVEGLRLAALSFDKDVALLSCCAA